MALALGEPHALLAASRFDATTDALTGLNNRRKLQLEIEHVLQDDGSHALVLLGSAHAKSSSPEQAT
jgi:GGDEF domain-containing protein